MSYFAGVISDIEMQRIIAESDFRRLGEIAVRELCKSGASQIVCGPITTGGLGSHEKNLRAFDMTVQRLLSEGNPLFNQVPYEDPLKQMEIIWLAANPKAPYCAPILEDFYRTLFMTRRFKIAWFIPGWESSKGATWERNLLGSLGAQFYDIRREWWESEVLAHFPYA